MKCPICEEQLENTVQECPICGFNKIRTEFINEEERQIWLNETVKPCRSVFFKLNFEFASLNHHEKETLKAKLKELQYRNGSYCNSAYALCEDMANPIDSGVSKGLLDNWNEEVAEILNDILNRLE